MAGSASESTLDGGRKVVAGEMIFAGTLVDVGTDVGAVVGAVVVVEVVVEVVVVVVVVVVGGTNRNPLRTLGWGTSIVE